MSILLSCEQLEKSFGHRRLFSALTFHVHHHERIGLIGPNGTGKSTLLKILGGLEDADAGEVISRKGVKLVYLPQVESFNPEHTLLEAAVEASKHDVEEIHEREANASIELSKIGFADVTQKLEHLSGGWLKRLSIARQLARHPDIMLLDEPTNHLDMEGIEWLEARLKQEKFSYIMVTHDRAFLENATNRVMELNDSFEEGVLSFDCAYEEFMRRRHDYLEAERSRFESLSNKNRREQEWVKAGVKARTTKQRSRVQDAEMLQQEVSKLKKQTAETPKILIDFESTDRKTKRLIVAHSISKSFDELNIVENLDLTLTPGIRVGLLGRNGIGKTTLMKMIAGEEAVDSGKVAVTTGCSVLHFDQKRQLVDEKQTLKEALSINGSDTIIYRDKPIHITSWARKLKFKTDQLRCPISTLSGGERARVIMGRLMLQTADVLLLDEPTNDLDIPSIEVLEESLMEFPGAIILVTHDRAMLDRVSNVLLSLNGSGKVEQFSSYDQWKLAQPDLNVSTKTKKKNSENSKTSGNMPNTKKKLTFKDQYEWDHIEETIQAAESEQEKLQNSPVSPSDAEAFLAYCEALTAAQVSVEKLYQRWEELEQKIAQLS